MGEGGLKKFFFGAVNRNEERLPIGTLFILGFIAGIIIINMGKGILLENTGLLDENVILCLKNTSLDSRALFYYVLKKRVRCSLMLCLFATTYLGVFVCGIFAVWCGVTAGAYITVLVLRFGIKGILLAVASCFPQYIIYIPAFYLLLVICEGINRKIYFQKYGFAAYGWKEIIKNKIIGLLIIHVIILFGCAIESFINPKLLMGILKFF